jgi:hypothetical protein
MDAATRNETNPLGAAKMATQDFRIKPWNFSDTEATIECVSDSARKRMGGCCASFNVAISKLPEVCVSIKLEGFSIA